MHPSGLFFGLLHRCFVLLAFFGPTHSPEGLLYEIYTGRAFSGVSPTGATSTAFLRGEIIMIFRLKQHDTNGNWRLFLNIMKYLLISTLELNLFIGQ
jgi:hypothetical protein